MPNADEYERVLIKAEMGGLRSLRTNELDLLRRLYREVGARGNRARRLIDGK